MNPLFRKRLVAPGALALVAVLAGCWDYVSEEARARLSAAPQPIALTVYPVRVVDGPTVNHDARLASRIAAMLRNEGLARAVESDAPAAFAARWHANEALMAQESAGAFGLHVKASAQQTDYGLLVEILCNAEETRVLGVHMYVAERSGEVALGAIANSHRPVFAQVDPRDREGGYEVAIRMLRSRLGSATTSSARASWN